MNNKKIDGELYAYLQSLSFPEEGKTVVSKKNLPLQSKICSLLGISSPKTYRNHLNILKETGYIIEEDDKYILPEKEDVFLFIPLETLKFLNDTLKENVIKIYIYLVQRGKYKPGYVFTIEEIGDHIGIKTKNYSRGYEMINNALDCLSNNGLITYTEFYEGNKPKKRLLDYSLRHCKKGNF